ncbi:MAG: cell division protein FtsL [Gammaproteobacteria bacterium]|nr:cell division protein FtsL [Gammaproteobacteria bacterium]
MRTAMIMLPCLLVLSGVAIVYAKHQNRTLYAELRHLEKERDEMNIFWGRLQLERSTFARHSEIESKAREQLGMVHPSDSQVRMVMQ